MRMTIALGPPGAGKSTWVQEQRAPGDVVIDFDRLAQACGSDTEHDAPPAVGTVTAAARTAMLARCFESLTGERDPLGADVWVAMTRLAQSTIDEWHGKGVEFVLIDPGIDEARRRAVEDGRSASAVAAIDDWYADPPKVPGEKGGGMLRFKSAPLEQGDDGLLVGYASVFGNVDSYGDVVMPGAFTKSLEKYGADGAGVPVLWGHRMDDPMMNIGATVSAREDEHGLRVEMRLDDENPTAVQARRLVQEGRVKAMSFAFDVVNAAPGTRDGIDVLELHELDIHEVSIVHVGANRLAEVHAAKTAPQTPAALAADDGELASFAGKAASAVISLDATLARHAAAITRKETA